MKRNTPPRMYEAFGERKTLPEWARDPRCPVGSFGLMCRVVSNGMTVEQAFAQPVKGSQQELYEAFGERKTLREWAQDPRCPLKYPRLASRVTFRKMTVEQVFAAESLNPRRGRWSKTKDKRNRGPVARTLTAWGETKTLQEWAEDPRANAAYPALLGRFKKGYPPEQVIHLPRPPGRLAKERERHKAVTAWGKTQSTEEWAADPRAQVQANTICARLARGWPPELAISARWWRDLTRDQQSKIRESHNGTPSPAPTKNRKSRAK